MKLSTLYFQAFLVTFYSKQYPCCIHNYQPYKREFSVVDRATSLSIQCNGSLLNTISFCTLNVLTAGQVPSPASSLTIRFNV